MVSERQYVYVERIIDDFCLVVTEVMNKIHADMYSFLMDDINEEK